MCTCDHAWSHDICAASCRCSCMASGSRAESHLIRVLCKPACVSGRCRLLCVMLACMRRVGFKRCALYLQDNGRLASSAVRYMQDSAQTSSSLDLLRPFSACWAPEGFRALLLLRLVVASLVVYVSTRDHGVVAALLHGIAVEANHAQWAREVRDQLEAWRRRHV